MNNVMEFTFTVYKMVGGWWLVDCKVQCQNHKENGANFCGPLRKAELLLECYNSKTKIGT